MFIPSVRLLVSYCAYLSLALLPLTAVSSGSEDICPVGQAYLEERSRSALELLSVIEGSQQAYACQIQMAAVESSLESYQVVQLLEKHSGVSPAIPGAITTTLSQLKNKSYLRDKPLLIIDKGFSRVSMQSACWHLQKAGFSQIKTLQGGVRAIQSISGNQPKELSSLLITPKELLYEYLNGEVIVLAEKTAKANLHGLGISVDHFYETGHLRSQIKDIAASTSSNSLPIAVINGSGIPEEVALSIDLNNVFFLDGGAESLNRYSFNKDWINKKREGIPNRFLCANG